MPWSREACAVSLANLYLMVSVGPMFGVSQAPPDDNCIFNLALRNFRTILSWELKNRSLAPTHYTLWYTLMSKNEEIKLVQECANITRPFCDLTHEWHSVSETYITQLVGSRGRTALVSCRSSITLDLDTAVEPPEFDVLGFVRHINVILKFPPTLPTAPSGKGLWLNLSLIIKEEAEGIVKQHKLKINGNTTGDFTYVLDKLIPNTNYCVSVYFEFLDLQTGLRSPLKCARLRPVQDAASSEAAKIGGLATSFFVAAVLVCTVLALRRVGYICLRHKLPRVLNVCGLQVWAFQELPPLEPVARVEVIHIHRKRRVWDYNYDDDESDGEGEAAPRASAGGYTMHGLGIRPLCPASTSSATLGDCSDPDAQEAEPPEPAAEPRPLPPTAPGPGPWPEERTRGACEGEAAWPEDPFPEDGSPAASPRDRIFFNVDLSSVFVRVPDGDEDQVPPGCCPPEEASDSDHPDDEDTEASLLGARGQGALPSFPDPPVGRLGPEDPLLDESDASTSGMAFRDGYMMRGLPKALS